MMIVVLKEAHRGNGIDADNLQKFMKACAAEGRIPKYGVPDFYEIVDAIPKTSVGKIDKKELRRIYATAGAMVASR
jgi:fatty-acyl-CoA synthase